MPTARHEDPKPLTGEATKTPVKRIALIERFPVGSTAELTEEGRSCFPRSALRYIVVGHGRDGEILYVRKALKDANLLNTRQGTAWSADFFRPVVDESHTRAPTEDGHA